MINQYPQYPYPYPEEENEGRRKWFYVLLGVVALIVVVSVFMFFRQSKPPEKVAVCGNGNCETGENCHDCSVDCKCNPGEYCSKETKKCLKPVCGNGRCEPFENQENCCNDCGCPPDYICNENTYICELPRVEISDERVRELVREYYEAQGIEVVEFVDIMVGKYGDKYGKRASVIIKGEEEGIHMVMVTVDEEVIPMPVFEN
ncbi:MAG: hypothetical protein ACTSW1_10895 [Candidatus Hodarchaeales archaeon]